MPVATLRRIIRFVPSLLLAAGVACRGSDASERGATDADGSAGTGGTLIIVVPAEPTTLFPPLVSSTQGLAVISTIFEKLADIGSALETYGDAGFVPRLASSWQWAADSLSIAFTLDSLARWHDGAPVRAEDVRYSFRAFTSDSVGSEAKSSLGNIDSVTVRDARTVEFWFKRRMPQQFFEATYYVEILPSHLLDTIPLARVASSAFARAPVGTGAFRFSRWEAGQRIEVIADTANPRGRAKLDRVLWTIAPDFGAATIKLFSGDADFFEKVRPENLAQVASSPTLRLIKNPALQYGFLGFNLRDPSSAATAHPIFGDSLVRRALAMSVDRERLVRNVFDSLGLVALGPAPRALISDTAAFRQMPFDVRAAAALLDSAGWRDSNADGVRDKNGVPLAFDLLVPNSSQNRQRYAVLLQEQWRPLGVRVTPRVLDVNALIERIESHRFDAYMGGWQTTPGLRGAQQTWASAGSSNYGRYESPAFDALLDSALTTFDGAASRQYWARTFQQIIDDAPAIWLYEEQTPIALHRRFLVPPLRADGWYYGLATWRVDPAQRIARDGIGVGSPP